MKIGILGAGISGLASALLLQDKRHEVVVFEKESQPGGLARTKEIDGYYFDLGGGHIFNSKSQIIRDWVFKFLPIAKWKYNIRRAKISYQGKLIDYPFELALGQIDPKKATECIIDLIDSSQGEEPDNFYDWLIWKFGASISKEYLISYNEKVWGHNLKEISTDWISGKLPTPNLKDIIYAAISKDCSEGEMVHSNFYYPFQGGIQVFVDAMCSKIFNIKLNTPVVSIKFSEGKWVVNNDFIFDKIISTIPLPELAKVYLFPAEINRAINNLKYRSTTIALFDSKVERDISWIYFPGPERYNKLSYVSNFNDHPRPAILADISAKSTEKEMQNLGLGRLVDYHFNEYSYPIFNKGYSENLPKIFDYLKGKGLYLVGRFAEWKYYNMDKCIDSAMRIVGGIL